VEQGAFVFIELGCRRTAGGIGSHPAEPAWVYRDGTEGGIGVGL